MPFSEEDKKDIGLFFQIQQSLSVVGRCFDTIKTSDSYKTILSRLEMIRTGFEELEKNRIFCKAVDAQTLKDFINFIRFAIKNLMSSRTGTDGVNKEHPAFKYYIYNATALFQNLKAKFEAMGEQLKNK